MKVNRDFRDLFAALNDAGARYLIIGGYALAFHARPRFTKDLDVFVEASTDNAQRVYRALVEFGAPLGDLAEEDLSQPGILFQMGLPPNRIDVLTEADGVSFQEAWSARQDSQYGDQPVHVIGREHLIKNKLATGRPQDLVDAHDLADHDQDR